MTPSETLLLFNEKSAQLLGSDFADRYQSADVGALIEYRRESGWDDVYLGPEDESLRAAIVTLRFFMQDNEPTSLRNMRALYAEAAPGDLGRQFGDICSELNSFLDSETLIGIEEGRNVTHRWVLDVFVYGEIAHANPVKRQTLRDLATTPFFSILKFDFVFAVAKFIEILGRLSHINESLLDQLDSS